MERTAPSLTGRGFARPRNLTPRSSEALVRRPAAERDGLPLLIEAQAPGLSLADWIREQGQSLHDDLNLAGGLLLRGFEVDSAERFRAAAAAFAPQLLDYKERSSPRSQVSGEVYTSTEHPLDQPIFLHNEQSYTADWPLYCSAVAVLARIWKINDAVEMAPEDAQPIEYQRKLTRRGLGFTQARSSQTGGIASASQHPKYLQALAGRTSEYPTRRRLAQVARLSCAPNRHGTPGSSLRTYHPVLAEGH